MSPYTRIAANGYARVGGPLADYEPDPAVEEETGGILSDVGNAALGGLGALGNILDTPGSIFRGLVGGVTQLDPSMIGRAFTGIFNPEDRVTGKELIGVDNNPDSWWDDIAGGAVEMIADPLNLVTLGGAGAAKGGLLATKAGLMPLAKRAGSKLVEGAAEAGVKNTLRSVIANAGDDVAQAAAKEAIINAAKGTKPGLIKRVTSKITGEKFGDELANIVEQGLNAAPGAGGMVDEPLRGGVGMIRWGDKAIPIGGVEAAKRMDQFGEVLRYGNWLDPLRNLESTGTGHLDTVRNAIADLPNKADINPIRSAAPYFQNAVRGMRTAYGQIMGQNASKLQNANEVVMREAMTPLMREWEQLPPSVTSDPTAWDAITSWAETGGKTPLPPDVPLDWAERWKTLQGEAMANLRQSKGVNVNQLDDDMLDYVLAKRQDNIEPIPGRTGMGRAKQFGASTASDMSREDILRGITRAELNKMSLDPMLVQEDLQKLYGMTNRDDTLKKAREYILDNYNYQGFDRNAYNNLLAQSQAGLLDDAGLQQLADMEKVRDNAKSLAEFMYSDVGDKYLKEFQSTNQPIGVFTQNPMELLNQSASRTARSVSNADALLKALPEHIKLGDMGLNRDYVSLDEFASSMNLGKDGKVNPTFLQRLGEEMGVAQGPMNPKQMQIPVDVAENLRKIGETVKTPSEWQGLFDAMDKATSFFKTFALLRPNFFIRNMISGQVQNVQHGLFSPSAFKASNALMNGETIKGIANDLRWAMSDDDATKLLAEMAFQHQVIPKWTGDAADLAGTLNNEIVGSLPGSIPANALGPLDTAKAIGQKAKSIASDPKAAYTNATQAIKDMYSKGELNPLNVRGVRGKDTKFVLQKQAEKANHIIEGQNRLTAFIEGLKQGYSPEVIAQKIKDMHVDYSNVSQFERSAMRRIFPFYTYSRNMLPYAAQQLMERPGGAYAQTIRGMNALRGDDELLPEHIAQTAAIPLGTNSEGDPRYMTGFGLMPEDSFTQLGSLLSGENLGSEFTSMLSPYIKAPIEAVTGRSMFQAGAGGGRELRDMDPVLGRIVANILGGEPADTRKLDMLLMNTIPAPLTMLKSATDTRKGVIPKALNTLTGIKITDVPQKTQEAMARELISDQLRELGGNPYTRVFISQEDLDKLSPEQRKKAIAMQNLLKELSTRAKKRSDEKKKAAKAA